MLIQHIILLVQSICKTYNSTIFARNYGTAAVISYNLKGIAPPVPVHLLRILQWWGKTTKGPIRAVASIYSWGGGGWGGGCRPKISE